MARIVGSLPAGPTNEAQIAAFESDIGHPLPTAYRDFLLLHNGGRPEPDAFLLNTDCGEQENILMCFFPMRELAIGDVEVEKIEDLRIWPLHCAWNDLRRDLVDLYEIELDEVLLPIGTDGSSNSVCLALDGASAGRVVFLDHETAEYVELANGFDEFLAALRPRERTDYAL